MLVNAQDADALDALDDDALDALDDDALDAQKELDNPWCFLEGKGNAILCMLTLPH